MNAQLTTEFRDALTGMELAYERMGNAYRALMADKLSGPGAPIQDLVNIAATCWGADPRHVHSKRRTPSVCAARWAVFWTLREKHGMTLEQIANLMKRDHTSICYGLRSFANLCAVDERTSSRFKRYQELTEKL